MPQIAKLKAREILDSRGNPTVEVDLFLADGAWGRAAVPSGASTGSHEALELRDGNAKRYLGKGVRKAVQNIAGPIQKGVRGKPFETQEALDRFLIRLDGTENKRKLGANAMLGVSLAFAHAQAASRRLPLYTAAAVGKTAPLLPVPLMNILNGGAHADNGLDVQEFMVVPLGFPKFSEALRAGTEIYHHLKRILKEKGLSTAVGDEGGFAPRLGSNEEGLAVLVGAIEQAGYAPGKQVKVALDVAANELFIEGLYRWEGKSYPVDQMVAKYSALAGKYPLFSIEDGLAEEDWDGWRLLTQTLGGQLHLVGDDLYTTSPKRLLAGIKKKSSNAILIKLNQIGTVTETMEAIALAGKNRFASIFSHRSGETEDTTIADLAVASGIGLIKTGAPCRGERVCKYNRLLRIEEELGTRAAYAGPRLIRQGVR